jgi:hypothetical protein
MSAHVITGTYYTAGTVCGGIRRVGNQLPVMFPLMYSIMSYCDCSNVVQPLVSKYPGIVYLLIVPKIFNHSMVLEGSTVLYVLYRVLRPERVPVLYYRTGR